MTTQEAIRTLKMKMLGDSEQMKCAKQIAIDVLEKANLQDTELFILNDRIEKLNISKKTKLPDTY